MNDQKIIELIRSGKSDRALTVLYKHFPMMRNLVTSRGGTAQDAEDVFQEALIILCRKAAQPGFTLTAQLSTYLFSVCRFLWNDELKKRKHAPAGDFETGLKQAEEEALPGARWRKRTGQSWRKRCWEELGERCAGTACCFFTTGE